MKKTILLFSSIVFLMISNQAQTITDYDGNVYNTVTIGTQIWLKENLNATHYNNGEMIPNVPNGSEWSSMTSGAYCEYENNPDYSVIYGKLYNWYTGADSRNLCPTGWHVPSNDDWIVLTAYLKNNGYGFNGLANYIGKSMAATSGWTPSSIAGQVGNDQESNDSSGFSALPGGYRSNYGTFSNVVGYGYWWTSTEFNAGCSYDWGIAYNSGLVVSYFCDGNPNGFSVRCVSDSTVSHILDNEFDSYYQIFPNPTKNRIHINFRESKSAKIQVFNTVGQCIMQIEKLGGTNTIDISSFPNGLYLIRITGNGWESYRKLIKE
jgi:uncharacterized protein (TIGR02145 family)